MTVKHLAKYAMVVCGMLLAAPVYAQYPSVPKETFEALNIDRSVSPKEFHEALTKRYMDPGRGAGKG
ncbi:MAG: hydroxylamine reductase, partial [Nitrospirota bacterium]